MDNRAQGTGLEIYVLCYSKCIVCGPPSFDMNMGFIYCMPWLFWGSHFARWISLEPAYAQSGKL